VVNFTVTERRPAGLSTLPRVSNAQGCAHHLRVLFGQLVLAFAFYKVFAGVDEVHVVCGN